MRSDYGQKHLKHVMTEAQPKDDMTGKSMAAVPVATSKGGKSGAPKGPPSTFGGKSDGPFG